MRKTTFALLGAAGLAAILSASAANAADLPIPRPVEPPVIIPPTVYSWTGLYIGVHAGYAWANNNIDDDFFDFDTDNDDDFDGFVGGGQIGYNVQFGSFVAGLEADLSWADLNSKNAFDYAFEDTGLTGTADFKAETDWLATVRGRAGYSFDRFMVYATGGVAFTNLEVSYRDTFTDPTGTTTAKDSASDTLWGWTIGAGVEGLITPNLTARLEYLYVDFSDDKFEFNRDGVSFSADQNLDAHIIRGGLNYKFNW